MILDVSPRMFALMKMRSLKAEIDGEDASLAAFDCTGLARPRVGEAVEVVVCLDDDGPEGVARWRPVSER